jgi:hypothetical protein
MSVIYTQGGAASVADATTTTSGKVRLATIAEAGGTSEAIAVTPAGLQAEISGLANGIIYRGSIDVADFGTTLANAELGDYYKISTGGTSGGVVYSVGDSIIVNADMGGTFSDAKLDRIDNVDPSTSDEITGNHNATNYTATNSDTLTTHLSGLDTKLGTLATVATSGAYADLSGTPTLATVATSGDYNDLANTPTLATVATSGDYNDLVNKPSADDLAADHVATNYTAADVNVDDHLAGIDSKLGTLATVATSGDYNDLLNAPALATVATSGAYADLSGTPTLATVATSGDYSDLLNTPSADDLAADHVPTNYTAADVNIDDHLAGIDTALGALGGFSSIVASNTANVVAIDSNTFVTLSSSNTVYPWKISVPASPSDGDAIALTVASGSDGEQANSRTAIEVYASDATTLLHTLNPNARRTLWVVYESASSSWLASPSYDALNRGSATSTTLTASKFGFEEIHIMERNTGDYPLTLPAAADVELGQVQIIRLRGPRNLAITSAASDIVDPTETNYSLSASNSITVRADAGEIKIKRVERIGVAYYELDAPLANLGDLAPLASPTFSGVPEAPTATAGTNTQQIATTAFVSAAVVAAGGLSNIVEDTSPQLGAALDVNGFAITSATGSNGDVTLDPDGTGDIAIGADLIPDADGTHTIGSESARYVSTYSDLNGAIRFKAKNDQGTAINKGDVVYIHSVSGDVPTVKLAQANNASTMPAFGLAASGANDQAEVQIISFGNLTAYDTTTLSLSVGDTLYVSATNAGELTNTAPAGEANLIQNIGRVVRASATEGIIKVGGAGRSAATPNLNDGKIFLGDSNNRSVPTALSSIALSSFNDDLSYQPLDDGLTSIAGLTTSGDELLYTTASDTYATATITAAGRALIDDADAAAQRTTLGLATVASSGAYSDLSGTPSADDLLADHTAVNYTASNANIDGHLAGIDSALASVGGSTNPNIYATTSSSYSPSASDAPDLNVWYGASSTANFTLTLPSITTVLTGTGATNSVVETFEMWVGRAVDGDIVINATDGIDGIGGASNTNVTTLTVSAGQWIKIVGWKTSSTNGKYLIGDPQSSSGISNIVEDTTPQLGGDLDPNGNAISGALIPSAANTYALGSADAEWSDLFLGDQGVINFGNDQDITLTHDTDRGLVIAQSAGDAFYPRLTLLNSNDGSLSHGELQFESQSGSPANNDFISRILSRGRNSAAQGFDYTKFVTRIGNVTDAAEAGKMVFHVATAGTVAGNPGTTALELYGDASGEIIAKIAEHDGASSGLMLGSTLVTSSAAELNLLDGGATVGSSITIADTDGIIVNDGGVSKLVPALDLKTYAGGGGGGTSYTYSAISSTTTAQAWYHYSVDTSSSAVTLNLPALSSVTDGDEIRVKLRVAGNDLTIDANSTETIDGQQTQTLSVATSSITLVAGSTEWEIV